MATVTDILSTTIRLTGVPTYAAEMGAASVATTTFAAAEGAATVATRTLAGSVVALQAALAPLLAAMAPLLTVAAVIGAAGKAISTFADDQQTIFRTAVVLKNLGSSLPVTELQQFAQELQKTVAVDDEAIVSLGGLLARFGATGAEIKSTIPAIVDAAAATGQSVEGIGETVGRALLGNTRGLKQLGIEFKATGNRARDLLTIQEELNKRFGGAGAAQRNTVQGAFTALSEATANFFSAVGKFLAPVIVPLLNKLTAFLQFLTEKIEALATRFPAFFGATNRATTAEGIGGEGAKQTALLEDIAENTSKQAEALVRAVLGGPGAIARGAATARDFKIAFGI